MAQMSNTYNIKAIRILETFTNLLICMWRKNI